MSIVKGWIGVDLDGTLARYDGWKGIGHVGEPIPKMVERVRNWIAEGKDVRIFTARITGANKDNTPRDVMQAKIAIEHWCAIHLGVVLPITNVKTWDMVELWDDRAVRVRRNEGSIDTNPTPETIVLTPVK